MQIIYEKQNGHSVIIDATFRHAICENFTIQERVAIFGCGVADSDVLTALDELECGEGTSQNLIDTIVSKGLMSQGRADEILA